MTLGSEICDDGNLLNNEGCQADCAGPYTGWSCIDHDSDLLTPMVCDGVCGDGLKIGTEVCDDGLQDGNGCNSDCSGAEIGWNCDYN